MNKSILNLKNILTVLLLLFIGIQFIDVQKNISQDQSVNAIGNHYKVPPKVKSILKTSCYDCHSNNTIYPSYSKLQPVNGGWQITSIRVKDILISMNSILTAAKKSLRNSMRLLKR